MKEFGLHEGIYSIRDAMTIINSVLDDESLKVNYGKVRRWFKELMEVQYEGLSGAEKADVENLRISFHGMIELYVIGVLRDNGFTLPKIMKARDDLGDKTKKQYPFATNNVKDNLKVAGSSIIFELSDVDRITLDGTGQFNLELITQFFEDIEFDTDGIATKIIPSKGHKIIEIDPKQEGGRPVVREKGVWVDTIVQSYTGPDSISVLVEQYDLDEKEIKAALDYSESYQN